MERIKKYEPLWGKWTVTRKIGEGSFGAVYEVESEMFGNKNCCAVKLISFKNTEVLQGVREGETLSAEELEQLKIEEARKNVREAVLMEKLQGRDHVVTIYDYDIFPGESTTDIIIRMELLTNLSDYMKLHKADSEEELKKLVVRLGSDIARALEECEKENIVHRDIKPDNIFVNKNGTFKLGDFGLSRKMNKSASFSLRKSAGTPFYMAPEALGWANKTDYQSDIYSLGMVMYQMLNDGKIPFVANMKDFSEIDGAIGRRAEGEELQPPIHEQGQLWTIIQKACQFKKTERYQNASEMRSELEKIKNKAKEKNQEKQKINERVEKDRQRENTSGVAEKDSKEEKIPGVAEKKNEMKKKNKYLLPVIGLLIILGIAGVFAYKKLEYRVGATVRLGNYPQEADGTEKPIEWIVLKKEGKKALLVSKYILDGRRYNTSSEIDDWWASDIREWLNNEFYRTAFNSAEKEKIQTTLVKTDDTEDTEDKIFLLSIKEAETLFLKAEERMAKATAYAKETGVYVDKENGNSRWWLRSLGDYSDNAAEVGSNGWVDRDGIDASIYHDGVRPALWLNLKF